MNMEAPLAGKDHTPLPPRRLQDTGLGLVLMRDILLKTVFRRNLSTVSAMARTICLPIGLTQELVDLCRSQGLMESLGNMHAGAGSEMSFALSDSGKARALDALEQSAYNGPMPVPLEVFAKQAARQSVRNIALTRERLAEAMGHLILPEGFLDRLGPAVTSGRSILMYGPPGNGKSSIANGIRAAFDEKIYIPHALEYSGQVITLFDPVVHEPVAEPESGGSGLRRAGARHDARYVACKRPAVITGGELTLDMLDLSWNNVSRTYQAPLQLKSTGGVFIVDDLGRQQEPAQALINRWIVPMEAGYDILSLESGEKIIVPFDTLVIFSTNFHPKNLFDEAALRRIFFKIRIDGPTEDEFRQVLAMLERKKRVRFTEAAVRHLFGVKYPSIDYAYANFHAPFLIDQMIALCDFEGRPYEFTPEDIDRAWENLFVAEGENTL